MSVLTKLTPQQERWIPEIRAECLERRDQADRADPMVIEQVRPLVERLCGLANEPAPLLLIMDSPFSAQMAALLLGNKAKSSQFSSPLRSRLRAQIGSQFDSQFDYARLRSQLASASGRTYAHMDSMSKDSAELRSKFHGRLVSELWEQFGDGPDNQNLEHQIWQNLWTQLPTNRHTNFTSFISGHSMWRGFTMPMFELGRRLGLLTLGTLANLSLYHAFLNSGEWGCHSLKGLLLLINAPKAIHWEGGNQGQRVRRLHRLNGPAVEFRDGYRLYSIAGARIQGDTLHWGSYSSEPAWLDNPALLTRDLIVAESNSEVRKGLVLALDPGDPHSATGKFLRMTDAQVLDQDSCAGGRRRLLSVDAGQQERWNILEVICPSQGHTHYLWVPPDIHSREDNPPGYTLCHIAVAWTFGFEGADVANYRTVAEA